MQILIVDDHAVVRRGFRQFLEQEPKITFIGEAPNGAEAMRMLQEQAWDLVLLDMHLPDGSGLELVGRMLAAHPTVRIIVVSGLPEGQYARNALRAGAYGFLPKECAADDLAKALKLVIGGRRYISPALAQAMAEDTSFERDSTRPLHTLLSGREFEVFRKIAAGARPTDIGAEMALSVKTVSTYRARIMDKMSFRCNADLTSYALRNNLIE